LPGGHQTLLGVRRKMEAFSEVLTPGEARWGRLVLRAIRSRLTRIRGGDVTGRDLRPGIRRGLRNVVGRGGRLTGRSQQLRAPTFAPVAVFAGRAVPCSANSLVRFDRRPGRGPCAARLSWDLRRPCIDRGGRSRACSIRSYETSSKPSALKPLPSDVAFEPTAFLERLAVLVPRPRVNLLLYYGLLAPLAAWRAEVVPRAPRLPPSRARGPGSRAPGAGGPFRRTAVGGADGSRV